MTLDAVKQYLKIEIEDDDVLLTSLIDAASDYIIEKTGKTKKIIDDVEVDIAQDDLYNLAIKLLVAHWYENRGIELFGVLTKQSYSHSVDALINHIALCGDYV